MDYNQAALQMHEEHHGKVAVQSKVKVENRDDLSTAYTPGVAEPCRRIHADPRDVYRYTAKGNLVAVVSDGTAVLGLAMRALVTPLTQLWGKFLSAPERQIAAADSADEWYLQLLALAVLPAVLEEALFGGVVLQTLLESGSRFGAWLLTTLFFSLLHGNLAALPAHLLFGGALTLAEMRTGNLLVPMVMHAVYNASALFWRGMSAWWLIFCGAAVLALGIWALMTLPRTAKMRMKRGHIMLSAAILLLMAVQYLL